MPWGIVQRGDSASGDKTLALLLILSQCNLLPSFGVTRKLSCNATRRAAFLCRWLPYLRIATRRGRLVRARSGLRQVSDVAAVFMIRSSLLDRSILFRGWAYVLGVGSYARGSLFALLKA